MTASWPRRMLSQGRIATQGSVRPKVSRIRAQTLGHAARPLRGLPGAFGGARRALVVPFVNKEAKPPP